LAFVTVARAGSFCCSAIAVSQAPLIYWRLYFELPPLDNFFGKNMTSFIW